MSTKRTGSVAVMTVVIWSFTVSSSISRMVSWARRAKPEATLKAIAMKYFILISIMIILFWFHGR